MKIRHSGIAIAVVAILSAQMSPALGDIQAGVTTCTKKGERRVENRITYVCALYNGSKTKLVWGRLFTPSTSVTKTKSSQPVVIVQSAQKPIPTLVPGTNIAWPVPSGTLSAYKGINPENFAKDLLGLNSLHEQGITGKGSSIAFIDQTILISHKTFTDTEVLCVTDSDKGLNAGTCPSTNIPSHGQGVAGTMGGSFGVAPGARLISISVDMIRGLNWVLNNFKKYNISAVSLSIGAGGPRSNLVCGIASPMGFGEVLSALAKEDVAVLFSTANQGTVNWVREPNCLPGVISVASVKAADPASIADYSSISPDIDVLAPADFYSASNDGKNGMFGGTSQATPFVAGIFALGKQVRPDANIAQIFYYMKKTAAPIDDAFVKNIPVVRPVEMVKALKEAVELPKISLVRQIQVKSGG